MNYFLDGDFITLTVSAAITPIRIAAKDVKYYFRLNDIETRIMVDQHALVVCETVEEIDAKLAKAKEAREQMKLEKMVISSSCGNSNEGVVNFALKDTGNLVDAAYECADNWTRGYKEVR